MRDPGPCPYHRATPKDIPSERKLPGEWQDSPRYPGDAVLIVLLGNGEDIGDIRVQEYAPDKLRVGSFLPGVTECSPGDTPKTFPECSEWVATREQAARVFGQYLIAALRSGWRLYDRNREAA